MKIGFLLGATLTLLLSINTAFSVVVYQNPYRNTCPPTAPILCNNRCLISANLCSCPSGTILCHGMCQTRCVNRLYRSPAGGIRP